MNKQLLSFFAICLMLFASCKDKDEEMTTNESPQNNVEISERTSTGSLRLGKKIPNPYSLSVMQQAYDELSNNGLRSGVTLEPTHLYLKFAPKNVDELRKLEADTTLDFYNYPLDVELFGEGGDYHDPTLPDSVPTYQYVCVPIEHNLPDVQYEVLDEIYIEEDNGLRSGSGIDWNILEAKAYMITGDTLEPYMPGLKSSQWYAEGVLQYEDDELGTVPLVGVQVRMRYHMITYHNLTDEKGHFKCDRKRRGSCKYSIDWLRDGKFKIRPNTGLSVADFVIQDNEKKVNYTFSKSKNDTQWFYASIFRAAKFCYFDNIEGLKRPEESLEMRASNYSDKPNVGGNYKKNGSTEIHIYRYKENGKSRISRIIYCNTIHELSHSIHCNLVGRDAYYDIPKSDKNLKDSWAVGISNYFTLKLYNEVGFNSYSSQYTGVVDDLLGNEKYIYNFTNTVYYPVDIQFALKQSKTWQDFRKEIKNIEYNDSYENEKIDNLFDYWDNYVAL